MYRDNWNKPRNWPRINHLALTKEYLKRDFLVFGCARNKPDEFENDEHFHFSSVDVADFTQVKNWAKEILASGLCPSTLINNAAIVNELLPLWEIPVKEFDRLIDVNIKGVANILRAFVPGMINQGSGIIINMSSGWGHVGDANVSSYCASKFAVEGLTQSLPHELPKGTIVVSLSPGVVQTQMLKNCAPNYFDSAIDADSWAKQAVPFIEALTQKENGRALSFSGD
jgi:NAD(P)-dependent dehydrogenase (short-subunit alcohol dehydrogenase family)